MPPDTRAVVVDVKPIFARGLESVLSDAGIAVDHPGDVVDWAVGPGSRVAIVAMSLASWREVIRDLRCARLDTAVVVVVDAQSPAAYAEALMAGACSAVRRDAPVEELAAVVDAAMRGFSLLPVGTAQRLVDASVATSTTRVSSSEVELLRALVKGDSVAALADELGYSEREMHRKLRKLYDRIGAANRTRAVVLATRWGLAASEEDHITADLRDQAPSFPATPAQHGERPDDPDRPSELDPGPQEPQGADDATERTVELQSVPRES